MAFRDFQKDLKREKVSGDHNRYEWIRTETLDGVDHYVLDAFPQYETLVLLDLRGDVLLQVGQDFDPPQAFFERVAQERN